MPRIRVTYYLEVISSWCHWAEPAWAELKAKYGLVAEFDWKIALMEPSAFPQSRERCEWFYRRSGTIRRSPYILNSGWFEPGLAPYLAPNLVALAAREFGITDDTVRLAIAHAALRDGKKVGRWDVAAEVASSATGIFAGELLAKAHSAAMLTSAEATTAEFHALQISQRPAFVIESCIGDKAVFSGLASLAPLAATIDAMLADQAACASFQAHFGHVPSSAE